MPGLDIGEASGLGQLAMTVDAGSILDRPAREGARRRVDILIDIAGGLPLEGARHVAPAVVAVVEISGTAERVQLEELAAVILIGGAGARGTVREVVLHRRTGRHRLEEGAEIAEAMGADDLAVIDRERDRDL